MWCRSPTARLLLAAYTLYQQAPSPDVYRGVVRNSVQPGHDYALHVKRLVDDIRCSGKKVGDLTNVIALTVALIRLSEKAVMLKTN